MLADCPQSADKSRAEEAIVQTIKGGPINAPRRGEAIVQDETLEFENPSSRAGRIRRTCGLEFPVNADNSTAIASRRIYRSTSQTMCHAARCGASYAGVRRIDGSMRSKETEGG